MTKDSKIIEIENAEYDEKTKACVLKSNKIKYKPRVSVIIPVYNADPYLESCLQSVTSQTLSDIEIICIDDGSTDDSLKILQKFASEDPRITVLSQDNLHAGVARNAGLTVAKGEYVHFLDADDWIAENTYEELYSAVSAERCNFAKFKSFTYDHQNDKIIYDAYTDIPKINKNRYINLDKEPELACNLSDAPWSGIYNLDFLNQNHIRFDNLTCANDCAFFSRCLIKSRVFYFIAQKYVFYRRNNDISLVGIRPYHFDCQIKLFEHLKIITKDENPQIAVSFMKRYENAILYRCQAYYDNPKLPPEVKKNILEQTADFYRHTPDVLRKEEFENFYAKINTASTYKISVIIPVYNTEKYLRQCLDSVINQTMPDIEVICIDDGSTDNSLNILYEYAAKDNRIKVIAQNNKKQGAARNLGIKLSRGKYIFFIDSDDYILPETLEKLYQKIEDHHAEICQYLAVEYDEISKNLSPRKFFDKIIKIQDYSYDYKYFPEILFKDVEAWSKLYLKEFLTNNKLEFPINCYFEDTIFHIKAMALASRICFDNNHYYIYRKNREGATTNTCGNTDRFLDIFNYIEGAESFFKSNRLWDNLKNYYYRFAIKRFQRYYDSCDNTTKLKFAEKAKIWHQNHQNEVENILITLDSKTQSGYLMVIQFVSKTKSEVQPVPKLKTNMIYKTRNSFKLFGHFPLYSYAKRGGKEVWKILGIPCWKRRKMKGTGLIKYYLFNMPFLKKCCQQCKIEENK